MWRNPLADDLNFVLEHTESIWQELRGNRIFLTGGTGFFGCWLLETFLWANQRLNLNAKLVALTRNAAAFSEKYPWLANNPALALHQGDVRNFMFPEGMFTHIIHAATEASAKLNAEQPLLMLDTILEGTRHTLNFAQACGAKQFLLTSSGAVYGRQPPDLYGIAEDYIGRLEAANPAAAYGIGKFTAEHMCHLYAKASSLEIKIARCFAFVGPYLPLDTHFAIGNFIRDAMQSRPIQIKGDGTSYRSYLYAAELAIWLWHILFRGNPLQPYNVGSEQAVSIAELAHIVAASSQPESIVNIEQTADPDKTPERYVPAVDKIKQDLGLTQQITLIDAIQKTKNWHLNKGIYHD